ncbi:MAG: single-stranded-DNA-specific exonuclease RecJ [Chitinophagales bacterium]
MAAQVDKRWLWPEVDSAWVEGFKQGGITPVLARILAARGFTNLEDARAFLNPSGYFADPRLLKGMTEAVARLETALAQGERVRVYGDYDVDGITSTSLLVQYLRSRGGAVDFRLPSRFEEGYGLSESAVAEAAADGVRVLVTVDCGITARAEADRARELGVDLIITDHHEPPDELPAAVAVVNPKQAGCAYPFKELSGVGLAFKLVQALAGHGLVGLDQYLDLVALGTVADVVPLRGENRLYAGLGLKRIRSAPRTGIVALMTAGNLERRSDAALIAFGLAPRLNAAGRLGDPTVGVELMLTDDPERAFELAQALEQANRERQELEEKILGEALATLAAQGDPDGAWALVAAGEGWHPGVIGIVASRLVERFHRPAVVISVEDGVGHGSARSIPEFNLHGALCECADLFFKFGGHAMAAGLTIAAERIPEFRGRLGRCAEARLTPEDFVPSLRLDAEVTADELTPSLVAELERLAPFGAGNPTPVLGLKNVEIAEERTVGEGGRHLKLSVRPAGGGAPLDCIGWQMAGYRERLKSHFGPVDLAFSPEVDAWRGAPRVQLVLQDLRIAGEPTAIDALFTKAGEAADPYDSILEASAFNTKAVGVTFEGRQEVLRRLQPGEALLLKREPENPHDPQAVRVETVDGQQVGYLRAGLARHLGPALDKGWQYTAVVSALTGGEEGRSRGVNLYLERLPSEEETVGRAEGARQRAALRGASDADIWRAIRQALLGGAPYREKQAEALARLQAGESTLVVMGTGRGKSAIFQSFGAFQALRHGRVTLILYPLRALVNDQLESARRRLTALGFTAYPATGALSDREREDLMMAISLGEVDFLLATPEFAEAHLARQPELLARLGLLVVDEAHHLAQRNSNRGAYRRLGELRARLGSPLALAVTATADRETARQIQESLGLSALVVDPAVRENLHVKDARQTPEQGKFDYLTRLFRRGEKTVVYVNSRDQAVEVARRLRKGNLAEKDAVAFYHGGLSTGPRAMLEQLFREGAVRLMVATSAFGEGVDIPDIRHVVHYHLPFNETDFNQQSGRAGRDGREAWIHLLYGDRDAELNRLILRGKAPDREALKAIYLALREVAAGDGTLLTNGELAELANARRETAAAAEEGRPGRSGGFSLVTPDTVSAAMGILAELGLVTRAREGAERRLRLAQRPEKKLDLASSVRYNEGMQERAAFEAFQETARTVPAHSLLAMVNRPIVPA